ncbi:hypothetical protein B0H13DRAFT_2549657 [Mycena leptocephala]|nr:hypothetical protein B0H13DRAFT_2549657 [Mycena leptocephala]
MSPSFSCGHLLYRSSVVRLDLHIEIILMRIAQLCAVFPLTLRCYDRMSFLGAGPEERARIVDAICARRGKTKMHRRVPFLSSSLFALRCSSPRAALGFRNWAVQRFLEATTSPEGHLKIVVCIRYVICLPPFLFPKALECEEEVCLLIVSELLRGDPATMLVNKHVSHVWDHGALVDPTGAADLRIRQQVPQGQAGPLICHETGSPVHAFENLEESAKDGIVDELLGQGAAVFGEVAKSQWGSYCIQHSMFFHLLRQDSHSDHHRFCPRARFATNEQGSKSVLKALKEGGKETLDRVVQRMCGPAKGARRAMIVDLALSLTGSQLIASVLLPTHCHAARLQARLQGYLALRPDARLLRVLNLYSLISLRLHDR